MKGQIVLIMAFAIFLAATFACTKLLLANAMSDALGTGLNVE